MLNKWICTGLIVTSLLWINGCEMPSTPMDLIKSPSSDVNDKGEDFNTVLRALLPDGARLLGSDHGNKGKSISFGDVDGDGIDEAMVVYEENLTKDKILKAALLKQHNEEWQIIWDTKGFGYGLDYAGLTDVTNDGRPEIILGWSLGAGENGLDIYEWQNNSLKLWTKKWYQGHLDLDKIIHTM
ncbi:hypothetical protein [Paenibacillus sp. N3.4]|uniref:hypothetical protein n=1 Tax=Paenibacillus sp. N3.4 TaxID=2603222 RepID=UPI0011C8706A|nr:hypothetical protein [Paenibacillus sp. N3.4]TXK77365.1 hypothetical protein FU659_23160 [Paenibacillus sp. N3.4]